MSELIDIYNQDKQSTGKQVNREKNRLQPGEYMLYALALIQNDKGQFLLTQRSRDKKWAAGWWEVPGGATKARENSFTAIRREVAFSRIRQALNSSPAKSSMRRPVAATRSRIIRMS